jgi:predicted dehydrogenase
MVDMTGRIRVGLIGAGNVALSDHLPTYLAHDETFEVVAIADPTADRLALAGGLAALPSDRLYPSGFELLGRTDLDMVDLCTPQHTRHDLVLAAAAAGTHVLSEKPLATIPAEAADMVAAMRAAGLTYGIVHNYLYFPEVLRVLDIIGAGEIGRPEIAILNWLGVIDAPGTASFRPTWRHDPRLAGGGVLMDMLHIVYLAEALLGKPIERVSAWIDARRDGAPVEDLTLSRFEAADAAALVNVGWGVGPGGFSVAGASGRIEVTYRDGGSGAFEPFERLIVHGRSGRAEETELARDASMEAILLDFAGAIREARDPVAPGEQGLHILEAVLAVYESAAVGRTVELPLAPDDPVRRLGVAGLAELPIPAWSQVRKRHLFGLDAEAV